VEELNSLSGGFSKGRAEDWWAWLKAGPAANRGHQVSLSLGLRRSNKMNYVEFSLPLSSLRSTD